MTLPLEGFRVLEVSPTAQAYCGALLADLGADIIRLDRVFPEGYGQVERRRAQEGQSVDNWGRNKRSVLVDLKTPEGLEIYKKLIKTSDAAFFGWRPGVSERLGIGYEEMSKVNPRIIYCNITGYGESGPYAGLVGHDMNYVGVAGIVGLTGRVGDPPILPSVPIMDLATGVAGALGILTARHARERTGRGQFIDISMTDVAVSWLAVHLGSYFADGISPTRGKLRLWEGPWLNIYECKDGKYVTMANLEPWFWEALCRELGKEEWMDCKFFFTHDEKEKVREREIMAELRRIMKTRTRDQWVKALGSKRVAIAPVNETLGEVFSDPHVVHRRMVEEFDHPTRGRVKLMRHPVVYSDTDTRVRKPWPRRGEHTEEVLRELGYSRKEIAGLRKRGVLPEE